jgi:5-methylcytosine-specific restriction enzyme subunit McrC
MPPMTMLLVTPMTMTMMPIMPPEVPRPRGTIPIQNLYHLLTYAWDVLPQAAALPRHLTAAPPDLHHLLASVLCGAVAQLLKRGLAHDYVSEDTLSARPRGKLLLAASVRQLTLPRRQLWCEVDERAPDHALNRLLKATLHFLVTTGGLRPALRAELQFVLRAFGTVTLVPLQDPALRAVRVHRATARYALAVHVCHLIRRRGLPTEEAAHTLFADYRRDRRTMARLFEQFVRQFFAHHLRGQARVWPKALPWDLRPADEAARQHLPQMQTDVVIEYANRLVLIECKYYPEALIPGQYGGERLRSGHLYQLYAYQQHLRHYAQGRPITALLLYPVAQTTLALRYTLEGAPLGAFTVNLHQPWPAVEAELLALLDG